MAAIHETAYPRIKPNLSRKELKEIFTPTPDELFLLNSKTKRTLSLPRLGFMITLKCYQYLGRPIRVNKVQEFIKNYIASNLDIKNDIDLTTYDTSARKRHIKIIREYLKINSDKKARRKTMSEVALNAATTKENLADIVNCIIDEVIRLRFELPPFQKLVRLSRAARTFVNNENYLKIFNALSLEQKKLIDQIVGIEGFSENDNAQNNALSWTMLKLESKNQPATISSNTFNT